MSSRSWSGKPTFLFFPPPQVRVLRSVIFSSWMISQVTRTARKATLTGSLSDFLLSISVGPLQVSCIHLITISCSLATGLYCVLAYSALPFYLVILCLQFLMRIFSSAFIRCSFFNWIDTQLSLFWNLMFALQFCCIIHVVVVVYLSVNFCRPDYNVVSFTYNMWVFSSVLNWKCDNFSLGNFDFDLSIDHQGLQYWKALLGQVVSCPFRSG